MSRRLFFAVLPGALLLAVSLAPAPSLGQESAVELAPELAQAPPRGQIRVQGRPLAEPETPLPAPLGLQVDLRQQMRTFVQSITAFARRYNRNFHVVTHGGLDLIIKRDLVDETRISPARTYMRSIDGMMIDQCDNFHLMPKLKKSFYHLMYMNSLGIFCLSSVVVEDSHFWLIA